MVVVVKVFLGVAGWLGVLVIFYHQVFIQGNPLLPRVHLRTELSGWRMDSKLKLSETQANKHQYYGHRHLKKY